MKKLAIWLVLILVFTYSIASVAEEAGDFGAGEASISAIEDGEVLTEDEDTQTEAVEDTSAGAADTDANAQGAVQSPAIRWTYPVSMTALHSEYNRLVNADNKLSETYEPADLEKMTVKRATSAAVYMRKEAARALERMFEAAKEVGYTLYLKSGYRSYGTQATTYNNRLQSNGGKDDGVVAQPGASEHQTGLSCDILNGDYAGRPRMTTDFAQTAEAQWMKENCAAYGFILRYPEGKTDITGIIFEPWHFRYVGKDVAGYVEREGITYEEFTDEWQLAVAEFQGRGGNIDEQIAFEETRVSGGVESIVTDVTGEDGDWEVSLSFY